MAVGGYVHSKMFHGSASSDPFSQSGSTSQVSTKSYFSNTFVKFIVRQEILANIRTVLAFPHMVESKMETFVSALTAGLPIAKKKALGDGLVSGLNNGMPFFVYGLGFFAGLLLVKAGWVEFGLFLFR